MRILVSLQFKFNYHAIIVKMFDNFNKDWKIFRITFKFNQNTVFPLSNSNTELRLGPEGHFIHEQKFHSQITWSL